MDSVVEQEKLLLFGFASLPDNFMLFDSNKQKLWFSSLKKQIKNKDSMQEETEEFMGVSLSKEQALQVNEEFVKRDDTYNVIVGGSNGSWQKIHDAGLHKLGGINARKKHGSPWLSFWNSLSDEEKIEWKK